MRTRKLSQPQLSAVAPPWDGLATAAPDLRLSSLLGPTASYIKLCCASVTEWLTVNEAAAYLRVHRTTIYQWCEEGSLPYFELRPGGGRRIRREDLDGLLKPAPFGSLQRRMAHALTYDAGNAEYQEVVVMIRKAIEATSPQNFIPWQAIEMSLAKAEAANPPDSERGKLVREARRALKDRFRAT